jgi:putative PEP-CTERM system histidine kinase
MDISFITISHGTGAIAYFLLALYIANRYLRRSTDRTLLVASLASSCWLAVLAAQSLAIDVPFYIRYTFELIRNAAWFGVLYALLGIRFVPTKKLGLTRYIITICVLVLLALMLSLTLYQGLTKEYYVSGQTTLILQISVSIVGLLLLEQVWRNASLYSRSSIKYLTIAIASFFAYDFFMYSDALLFQELSAPLWDTRGAINALVAPFIALTMINSSRQPIGMHVSRQMVFHSTTLVLAGIYLLIISAGGYYISFFGGTWGEALRVLFIFAGILLLVILVGSPVIRARIMVFISKNFFDYKYDYRDEWIKSTNALADTSTESSLPLQIIRVLGGLIGCRSGAIWARNEDGQFVLRAKLNITDEKFDEIDANSDLVNYFRQNGWIINLDEYMQDPTLYNLIEIPDSMISQEKPWLIIPLGMTNNVTGFVLLCDPVAQIDLNWENYDLLKIVAQQARSYMEQTDAQEKLAEARQFDAVNKTSAFLVHDIKTIIAQLSLLVKNAERHKSNPEFIEDMIRTTGHTVEKMDYLLKQIRSPGKSSTDETFENVELGAILLEVYQSHKKNEPVPSLETLDDEIWIRADPLQLKAAIGHIVQNALDATAKDGEVSIAIKQTENNVYIFIQDSGTGMSEDYVNHQLFKPFESTKGLAGMGIGVYQSREYLKRLGGSISVTSQLGVGTCFTLNIPIKNSVE